MRTLLRFSINHPWVTVCVAFSLFVLLVPFIPKVRLELDARSLVPSNHPDLAQSDAAAKLFGVRDRVVVGVASSCCELFTPETLARIDRIGKELSRMDGVIASSVTSVTTTPRLSVKGNQIDLGPLLPDNKNLEARDVAGARQYVEEARLDDGILVSRDHRSALILADIEPSADRYSLLQQIQALKLKETSSHDSIQLSGTGLAQATLGQSSALDLLSLAPIAVLVLAGILTFAFRHPIPAIISLIEIGLSLSWTIGIIGLTGQSVFVTTLVLPVILISVGVSDDVYVLKRYFTQRGNLDFKSDLQSAFGSMIWPVGLTTVSTVVGLLSMAAAGLVPLRVFGIFGALAILFSTLLTFSLVPALLIIFKADQLRIKQTSSARPTGLALFLFRAVSIVRARRILVATAILGFIALLLTSTVKVDDSWIRNLPPDSEIARGDKAINESMAGTTTLDLMVDYGAPDAILTPQAILNLNSLEASLAKLPHVGAVYGIHDDILRLNASLREIDYGSYRDSLSQGLTRIDRKEIEQSLMLLTVAGRSTLSSQLDSANRRTRITIFVRSADYQRLEQIIRTVSTSPHLPTGAVTFFGDGWISYTTVGLLVQGQIRSIIIALLIDLLLITAVLRSFRLALISVVPVFFSVLVIFGLLGLTGISLGIANSMFSGIAIGIGLDFAIHLTAGYRDNTLRSIPRHDAFREVLIETAPAIVTSAAAIATGFAVLTLSTILPNAQLGLMISLSITVCAITSLFVVSSMLALTSGPRPEPAFRPVLTEERVGQ